MSPRFYLFVSDVNQRNEEAEYVQDFFTGCRDGETLFRSSISFVGRCGSV